MAGKKKSQKKDTVQETLGSLVESKKKTAKKPSKKSTAKASKKKPSKTPSKPKTEKKTTSKKKKPTKKPQKKPDKKPEPEKTLEDPGPSLKILPGVGQKLEEKLKAAKYDTVDKISRSRSKSMAKKVDGLSLAGAKKLITAAKELVKGGPTQALPEKPPATKADEVEESPAAIIRLTDLPGVGAKLAKELERSGYNTVARLSRSRPSSVAKVVDGLSLKKATTLVDASIELIREAEMIAISETIAPKAVPEKKPEPKEAEPKKKAEPKEVPAPKKEEPPKKAPKKTAKPKKPKKPVDEPAVEVPKKRKAKKKKSGLPVPDAVKSLEKEMKKKWRAAAKRKAAIEAGEIPEEELVPLKETVEVLGMTISETQDTLVDVAMDVLNEAMLTGRPAFEIPSRSGDNIVWDEIRDLLLLGMKTIARPYHSLASVVDATRTARVMEIVFQLLKSNLHATKREVFYSDVNLFREQKRSDKIVEDVASMLHTTRDSIHVVASARGSAMGRVVIRDGGDTIDLTRMGTGGWAITPFLDQVEILESDAEFIILSEKDAAVMRLAEAKYWNRQPCIVLTGKGSGDIATRAFLRMLVKELEIPAFALVDSDPYGHYIYSVFLRGSKRLSYESPFIATPELKLLGVLSRDLEEYNIPKSVRIPMEPTDIKRVRDMLNEPFVQSNKAWVKDLRLMLKLREKAEIQAFASHSFEYLTDDYLPRKLETGDWI
ncbi:MAG: helix-hairpin-helix domain-containing protein [Candidatus Thorarchaeota archaeon]|jgi:meiotic recombination protein SPO11